MSLAEIIRREMTGILPLTDDQLRLLEDHYALMVRWNSRMSLTTVTDLEEAATRHYCESLFLASILRRFAPRRVADVGSGPGFPGIPLAVVLPEAQVTLIESNQRKAVFLRESSRKLSNVSVTAKRAEDMHEVFDIVVSRAVDPTSVLRLSLAPLFCLLLGTKDAHALEAEVIALPWGSNRVVAIVSRGTV